MIPNLPVTIGERLVAISIAAMFACIVYGIAFGLHSAISKDSPSKRIQGRPIAWWVTGLMFLGSCVGAWMADNQSYYLHEVVGGMGGFGLLTGLVIGNVHGFVDLLRARATRSFAPTDHLDSGSFSTDRDNENPYAPPRHP
jgi:carbon starvation protein CstA